MKLKYLLFSKILPMKILRKIRRRIIHTMNWQVSPPPYELKREILSSYKNDYALNVFIETGTFFGDTVEYFKNSFKKVYSIELAEELAKKAKLRFANDSQVEIIQGDSGSILKGILKDIDEPVLFWLDGHYSSEFFVGDEFIKTARTDKDTPVVEELDTILSSPINHVILIDDARLFDGLGDYPSISSIKRKVRKAKGPAYGCKVENDIIQICPKIVQ